MDDQWCSKTGSTVFNLLRGSKDRAAWERFANRYGPQIHRWCERFVPSKELADDVAHEMFLRLHRGIVTYDREKGRFRSWLKAATRNTSTTFLAKEARAGGPRTDEEIRKLLDRNPAAARGMDNFIEQIEVEEIFQLACEGVQVQVEPKTWLAFQRYVLENIPVKDVANELGMTLAAVHQALYRVRGLLKGELRRLEDGEALSEDDGP